MSSGSPSSAAVEGMNPKSKGKLNPCGNKLDKENDAGIRLVLELIPAPFRGLDDCFALMLCFIEMMR